jgi:spermidine synthase
VTRATARLVPGVALFVATTFASAFLIFLVQPLVAKRILPWFGGVPAVWSLCLAFYQTTLFAGYAYAHGLLRRASPVRQLTIHAAVVAAAVLALPVLPSEAWKPEGSGDPSAAILAMLVANVALPFFALAATGPLVALWFSRRYPARSPYPLYAVSNAGSLLALLAYPFALEPRLPLSTTGRLWSGAFAATGAAVVACAALAAQSPAFAPEPVSRAEGSTPPGRIALWVLLSACAVVLLMGITNHLCLDVASVPFLWILPLAIYLATLILCFGAPGVYRRIPFALLAVLCYFAASVRLAQGAPGSLAGMFAGKLAFEIARYGLLLFAACMVLHGEMYRLRPPAHSLTAFYLCTSGGGALGGLAVGLVAPRVFDGFSEYPLGLALACVLMLVTWRLDPAGWLARSAPRWRFGAAAAVTGAAVAALGWQTYARPDSVLYQERSFFGVLRVQEIFGSRWRTRILIHGTTLHGIQIDGHEQMPTAYFGAGTGIETALSLRDAPAEIGVIGLGAGTLAAYGRAGDHFRFFEIDPAVIRIARDPEYFTFVANSAAQVEIVQGDGRIALARERERNAPRFDYLIVDAYSGDAVPVHLLTREAIALYLDSLQPDGCLVFHASARYFDLVPLIFRLAEDAHLFGVNLVNNRNPFTLTKPATWVFVSRSEARIRAIVQAVEQGQPKPNRRGAPPTVTVPTPETIARAPLWTDDYSNLLRVLRRQPGDFDDRSPLPN